MPLSFGEINHFFWISFFFFYKKIITPKKKSGLPYSQNISDCLTMKRLENSIEFLCVRKMINFNKSEVEFLYKLSHAYAWGSCQSRFWFGSFHLLFTGQLTKQSDLYFEWLRLESDGNLLFALYFKRANKVLCCIWYGPLYI